jgi:hypothetical protein
MKTSLALACAGLLLAVPAISADAKIIRQVEKTFPVQPGGLLKAKTQGGDIEVRTADISEVRVTARQTIHAATEAKADELLEKLELTMEQRGNDVICEARYGEKQRFRWSMNWPPVQVDFIVTVPKSFNADLNSAATGPQGKADAGLFKATINLDLSTSGGDITVGDLQGSVKAQTSGGDLRFARIGGDLTGTTSGGDIDLQESSARARLSTSGGDIKIDRANGPTEVSTSGGNIRISSVRELISASTSGGDIHAEIDGTLTRDTALTTSGGNVKVSLRPDAAFRLDASTSGGDVDATGLTIRLERGGNRKSRLVGDVNGGGPTLKLRTSGGDIDVRTGN